MNFVGLDNFRKLFHDDIFLKSLRNNIVLAHRAAARDASSLTLRLASLVTVGGPSRGSIRGLRGSSFYRIVSFFPYIVPAIVIGLIWAQIYDPSQRPAQRHPDRDRARPASSPSPGSATSATADAARRCS